MVCWEEKPEPEVEALEELELAGAGAGFLIEINSLTYLIAQHTSDETAWGGRKGSYHFGNNGLLASCD
ncbi:hypothetical protein Tco_0382315 [Tanacetum coccineum]